MYDPISRLLVNYVQIPITTFVLTPMGVSVPSLDPIRPVIKSIVFFGALNIVLLTGGSHVRIFRGLIYCHKCFGEISECYAINDSVRIHI